MVGPSRQRARHSSPRRVAGEGEFPFFIISGSEFVELFAGAGAARCATCFRASQEKAPASYFQNFFFFWEKKNELDAMRQSRSGSMAWSAGNDEREQTLTQLLTEMDWLCFHRQTR